MPFLLIYARLHRNFIDIQALSIFDISYYNKDSAQGFYQCPHFHLNCKILCLVHETKYSFTPMNNLCVKAIMYIRHNGYSDTLQHIPDLKPLM